LEGLDILLGRVLIVAPVDRVGEKAPWPRAFTAATLT